MIVVVGPVPPPTHGAARVTQLVMDELGRRGFQVRAVNTQPRRRSRAYHLRRIAAHAVAAGVIVRAAHVGKGVLYQTGAGGMGVWYQVLLALLARACGLRQCYHHHSYAYLNRNARAMSVLRLAAGRRTTHVFLSEGMAATFVRCYGVVNWLVLSNAVFLGERSFAPPGRTQGRSLVVGHLSNLTAAKGALVVLAAIDQLRQNGADARLVLAGPALEAEVEHAIREHVTRFPEDSWIGPVKPADVPAFMRQLDCLAFPSSYANEAEPLVVLEALRDGVPVVATPVGCLPEVLQNGSWLCAANPDDVAAAVRRIAGDPSATVAAGRLYDSLRQHSELDLFISTLHQEEAR